MISLLKNNYKTMTNRELASALNLRLTSTRTKLYELGLKRMEQEYFTTEQTQFLKEHYKVWGDVEIAAYFQTHLPKNKKWTEKHIRKKRLYLNLHRTPEQVAQIKLRNVLVLEAGKRSNKKRWAGRVSPIGTIRKWKYPGNYPGWFIKTEKGFVWLATYNWRKHFGELPPGYVLRRKNPELEGVESCDPENLELITHAENQRLNFYNRDNDNWYASIIARGDEKLKQALLENKELLNLFRINSKFTREIKNAAARKAG